MDFQNFKNIIEYYSQKSSEKMYLRGPFSQYPLAVRVSTCTGSWIINTANYWKVTANARPVYFIPRTGLPDIERADALSLFFDLSVERNGMIQADKYAKLLNDAAVNMHDFHNMTIQALLDKNPDLDEYAVASLQQKARTLDWFLQRVILYVLAGEKNNGRIFEMEKIAEISESGGFAVISSAVNADTGNRTEFFALNPEQVVSVEPFVCQNALYDSKMATAVYDAYELLDTQVGKAEQKAVMEAGRK